MTTQVLTQCRPSQVRKTEQAPETYFQPATDVKETADAVELLFDMPGVSKDHVELIVEKQTLTVTGRTTSEEAGKAVYRETRIGNYRRSFSLSETVDSDQIQAEMKAGVLTVRIPKPEKAKPKRIEVSYN